MLKSAKGVSFINTISLTSQGVTILCEHVAMASGHTLYDRENGYDTELEKKASDPGMRRQALTDLGEAKFSRLYVLYWDLHAITCKSF
jgi:hypothetical protein